MNILLIGINYAPEPTGIGKYTGELGAFLAAKGHKVSAITSFPYYPQWKLQPEYRNWWWQSEVLEGVKVTRCPLFVPANPSGLTRIIQDLSFLLSSSLSVTKQIILRKKYQMVFVASPSFMSGWVGLWYKLWYPKTTLVYHIQDLQIDAAEELGMIKNKWLLSFFKSAEGVIIKKSSVVSTISVGMMNKIKSKPFIAKRYIMFPNWVSNDYIFPCTPNFNIWQKFELPPHRKVLFYSGAMGKKQGLDIVLALAQKARLAGLDWYFVMAGSGPFAAALAEKATEMQLDNTKFIPLQPLDVFNQLLNATWVHLVIQKDEAADLLMPSKLTNILAVGGLALVTASPGTTLYEEIASYKMGLLTAPEMIDDMWNVLLQIERSPAMGREYRKNAENYAYQHLKQENIISRFIIEIEGDFSSLKKLKADIQHSSTNNQESYD